MQGRPTGPLAALLNDYEYQFLSTLSGPIRAVKTMLLVKTLSNHAKDEEYLGGAGTEWILVSSGAQALAQNIWTNRVFLRTAAYH